MGWQSPMTEGASQSLCQHWTPELILDVSLPDKENPVQVTEISVFPINTSKLSSYLIYTPYRKTYE